MVSRGLLTAGDIIWQLTPLKDIWQREGIRGELYINRNCHPHWRMPEDKINSLLTLIEVQPYVSKCGIVDDYVGRNLDHLFRNPWQSGMNLSDIVHHRLGMPHTSRTEPWLLNIEAKPVALVVMHRSPRYHVDSFPWQAVIDKYAKDAVFVGSKNEHDEISDIFGPVQYLETKTFLELAQVIKGAKLFIGNQSSPGAVAQGLKQNMVQEVVDRWHWAWDVHVERPGYWDSGNYLPDLADLK